MGLITRSEMRSYMECDGVLCEIGEGFTDLTENKNPKEYARQYIHESTERTDLVGFAPSITYAFDVYDADMVQKKLLDLTTGEAVGEDAVVSVVTAFLFKKGSAEGRVPAMRRSYTVCPAKLGSGTDTLICSGTLKACGDAVSGELDTEKLCFIEA